MPERELFALKDDPNKDNARRCGVMLKEQEMQLRLSAERWAKNPRLKAKLDKSMSDSELAKKALKSSAQHFIDTNNNCPSPYDALREGRPLTPDRLLRYGLSGYNTQRKNGSYAFSGINQDGEGRAGYLRYRGMLSPVQKYDRPITSSQTVGWGAETFDYKTGKYNRKPLIEQQFFRTMNTFWPAL
jgi:hypothetical protein